MFSTTAVTAHTPCCRNEAPGPTGRADCRVQTVRQTTQANARSPVHLLLSSNDGARKGCSVHLLDRLLILHRM